MTEHKQNDKNDIVLQDMNKYLINYHLSVLFCCPPLCVNSKLLGVSFLTAITTETSLNQQVNDLQLLLLISIISVCSHSSSVCLLFDFYI